MPLRILGDAKQIVSTVDWRTKLKLKHRRQRSETNQEDFPLQNLTESIRKNASACLVLGADTIV
jgi:hypothetical protein